ncbi:hypothetical protein Trydic_g2225 [Trypoxylus dichotomus]
MNDVVYFMVQVFLTRHTHLRYTYEFLQAIVCCLIATTIAADDSKLKKKDPRGKRNLDYTISHHHYPNPNFRAERRISLGPHINRYPPFFPGRQSTYRKGRPQSLPPPPYAVQMEPLVQYSQRDPLYDPNVLHVPPVNQNDLTKTEDLATDNNRVSENVYGPPKHVIERPIYIKEPEPIIEIIIKESNVTYPPIEVPAVTSVPKKKEQVQVFYVKYKKNPHGKGKDSIIYEKPIPAISPPIKDEEPHYEEYKQPEIVTSPPPPSTTLRAIIKPDSETYHANKGIHITFGKEHVQEQIHDDLNEESAPEPAVSLPQGREFNGRVPPQSRHESLASDVPRIPQSYRPFNQPPPSSQFPQFGRKIIASQAPPLAPTRHSPPPLPPPPSLPIRHSAHPPPPPPFTNRHPPPPPNRGASTSFVHFAKPPYSQPPPGPIIFRQPVPYQPFDQIKPQENPVQFPRPHTHFPVRQQLPLSEPPTVFNQQHLHNRPPEHQSFNQQLPSTQNQHQFNQPPSPQVEVKQPPPVISQPSVQLTQNLQHHQQLVTQEQILRQQQQLQEQVRQHEQIKQQQLQLQQQLQQQQKNQPQFPQGPFVPPGGELVESVPRFEQHYSVGTNGQLQPQDPKQFKLQHQQPEQNREFLPSQQVQQQFRQDPTPRSEPTRQHNIQQHNQPTVQIQPSQATVQIQPSQETEKFNSQPHFEHLRSENPQLDQIQRHNQQIEHLQRQNQQRIEHLQRQNSLQQYQQNFNLQPTGQSLQQSPIYVNNLPPSTTHRNVYQTATQPTPTTTPKQPETTTKDPKVLNLQLPDEVPDDLRQHLLSSGILNNADISVLDYDKVGDIPLSALPPDQLANFYSAGGAQQIASGSAPIPTVVKPDSAKDLDTEASENVEYKVKKPDVEMKVVHYDPESEEGKKLQDSYVKGDATHVDPVELSDNGYNRYLPLKVSGAQFPIPDIPELKGKKINSVVVLAPVDYKFQENARVTRNADAKFEGIKFPKGSPLKELIDHPTRENFNTFLENENKTSADQQAVILLVAGSSDDAKENREIFMYDVASQTVSKLSGDLSSAFVDAADANTDDSSVAASNVVEVRVPSPKNINPDRIDISSDLEDSASDILESKVRIIDPMETEASEQLERFVDISGQDLEASEDQNLTGNEVESDSRNILAVV